MKISFILGRISVGQDGVTDYVLRVVRGCIELGHTCQIIGLNPSAEENRDQVIDYMGSEASVTIAMIPSQASGTQRGQAVCAALDSFAPDWVSLQLLYEQCRFKKSIADLASVLRVQKRSQRQTHVILHEIWRSYYAPNTLQVWILSQLKKWILYRFLRVANPDLIHVTNTPYQRQVRGLGFTVSCLPMISTIPLHDRDTKAVFADLNQASSLDLSRQRDRYWIFGVFGNIIYHPRETWTVEPLFSQIKQAAQTHDRQALILWLGSGNPWSQQQWQRISQDYGSDFKFVSLGFRSREVISQYLQEIDWGIPTTPFPLLRKSTTIAAMFEHRVRLIFNCDPPDPGDQIYQQLDPKDQVYFGFPHDPAPDPATDLPAPSEAESHDRTSYSQQIIQQFVDQLSARSRS